MRAQELASVSFILQMRWRLFFVVYSLSILEFGWYYPSSEPDHAYLINRVGHAADSCSPMCSRPGAWQPVPQKLKPWPRNGRRQSMVRKNGFLGMCFRNRVQAAMCKLAGQYLGATNARSKGVFLGSDCAWLDRIESHQI